VNHKHVEQAFKNLLDEFDCFCVMEKYQQTLNLVCDLLRVGEMDSGCFPRFNENPTKAYSEVTDKDYEILRELNYYDILFYEKVLLEF